jgi:hypothetical protein
MRVPKPAFAASFCFAVLALCACFASYRQSSGGNHVVRAPSQTRVVPRSPCKGCAFCTGALFRRSTTTGHAGEYEFQQLPPGTYQLTIEMTGFARA